MSDEKRSVVEDDVKVTVTGHEDEPVVERFSRVESGEYTAWVRTDFVIEPDDVDTSVEDLLSLDDDVVAFDHEMSDDETIVQFYTIDGRDVPDDTDAESIVEMLHNLDDDRVEADRDPSEDVPKITVRCLPYHVDDDAVHVATDD